MKRTETQSYRLTENSKAALSAIAEELKIPSGQLVAVLVETYIEEKIRYGNQVFYPPRFHTFESIKFQEGIDKTNAEREMKH